MWSWSTHHTLRTTLQNDLQSSASKEQRALGSAPSSTGLSPNPQQSWLTVHTERNSGWKPNEAPCAVDEQGLQQRKAHLRKNSNDRGFLHPPVRTKATKSLTWGSLFFVTRSNLLPRWMLDGMYFLPKNHIETAFFPSSSEQFPQSYWEPVSRPQSSASLWIKLNLPALMFFVFPQVDSSDDWFILGNQTGSRHQVNSRMRFRL